MPFASDDHGPCEECDREEHLRYHVYVVGVCLCAACWEAYTGQQFQVDADGVWREEGEQVFSQEANR